MPVRPSQQQDLDLISETTSASEITFAVAVDLSTQLLDAFPERSGINTDEPRRIYNTIFVEVGVNSQIEHLYFGRFPEIIATELPAIFINNFSVSAHKVKEISSQYISDNGADSDERKQVLGK